MNSFSSPQVATTNNLINDISNGVNIINLSPPLIGIREGDYYGYRIKSSTQYPLYVNMADTNHLTYYNGGATSYRNYDWSAEAANDNHIFVIEPYMERPYMVFIGDSIIAGWGNHEHYSFIEPEDVTSISNTIQNKWSRKMGDKTYQNMGVNGHTSTSIKNRFTKDVVNLIPEFALIEGGINDVKGGISNTIILNNWKDMNQQAYNNNIAPVILLILPCTTCDNTKMSQVDYINSELIKMSKNYSSSIVIDARCNVGVFRNGGPPGNCWNIDASLTVDGLHYNSYGTERIAQTINDSFTLIDNAPPASVTGLAESAVTENSITWTWTDPADVDFNHIEIYLDNVFQTNVSAGTKSYTAHGLSGSTTYTLGTKTVDTVGNVNSSIVTHSAMTATTTVTNPPSRGSGGGGGGGGSGTSGEDFSNIEVKEKHDLYIFKDKTISYTFDDSRNPIVLINITGNVSAGEITTTVEVLKNTSSLVTDPAPGTVFKNVNVWVGTSGFAVPKNIKKSVIRFRVENLWISGNSIESSSIKMARWDKDAEKWDMLDTSKIMNDSRYTYFDAQTNALSPLAITSLKEASSIAMLSYTTAQPEIASIITGTTEVPPSESSKGGGSINFSIIFIVFALIGIVIAVYSKRKGMFKE